MYYAHSTPSLDRSDWQELAQHLRQVAQLASHRGDKFGAANATALAGWLHDLGKYAEAFSCTFKVAAQALIIPLRVQRKS